MGFHSMELKCMLLQAFNNVKRIMEKVEGQRQVFVIELLGRLTNCFAWEVEFHKYQLKRICSD